LIRQQSWSPVSPGVGSLVDELLFRYGDAVQAILFYGSCLRSGDDREGLVDLYLLVDSYRSAYDKRITAFLNKLLPPNVFYLEAAFEDQAVRAKYAIISLADFLRGTSTRWFHSYLWGRFAQPTAIVYARNDKLTEQVQAALAQAVLTFVTRVLPAIADTFVARELWREGLSLTYGAEIRAEGADQPVSLFDSAPRHYEHLTRAAMAQVRFAVRVVTRAEPVHYQTRIPTLVRRLSRLAWRVRSLQGKVLSVLRLMKGLATFQGGPDYILWKIERHSGVSAELTPRMRKYPLLAALALSWRLYRSGGFH
jgi:hypothetical protein